MVATSERHPIPLRYRSKDISNTTAPVTAPPQDFRMDIGIGNPDQLNTGDTLAGCRHMRQPRGRARRPHCGASGGTPPTRSRRTPSPSGCASSHAGAAVRLQSPCIGSDTPGQDGTPYDGSFTLSVQRRSHSWFSLRTRQPPATGKREADRWTLAFHRCGHISRSGIDLDQCSLPTTGALSSACT